MAERRAGLSPERIVDAALQLIEEQGLEALSTRKLGQALGCEAMALYHYYPSKDALLDAVVDQLMAPVAAVELDERAGWVDWLRRLAQAYRRQARNHPQAFPLLATRSFTGPRTQAFLDRLFTVAQQQGIPDQLAARCYRAVSSYCSGFCLNELAQSRQPLTVPPHLPQLARVARHLQGAQDPTFAFGLETLLAVLTATDAT